MPWGGQAGPQAERGEVRGIHQSAGSLLATADIVFNLNRPEVNEKLGIDWRTLTARFPKLIVVSITFFGAESAYKNLRGGDLVATHMSGVGYETPWHQVTDHENQPPLKLGGRQTDYLTGYTAAARRDVRTV